MNQELFSRSGLQLEHLIELCKVAEAGGYTKAAHNDSNQQSKLSKHVAALEKAFGVELLRGNGRGAELTTYGERLVTLVRMFCDGLEQFDSHCKALPMEISIGAGDALLQWSLLPKIADLRRKLPNIIFDVRNLRTSQITAAISSFSLHFGMARKDSVPKGHKCESLGKHTYSLFAPKALLRRVQSKTWEAVIEDIPIATLSGDGEFRSALEEDLARLGIELNCALSCSSFPQATRALQTGSFAAILPTIASTELGSDRFRLFDPPFLRRQAREICLIWNRRLTELRPELLIVKDTLVSVLRIPA